MERADCSVVATIKLLSKLTGHDLDTTKEMVYRNMEENWYINTRKGGPGIDLTLLFVNLLDLFEDLKLDKQYEIKLYQLDGNRAQDFNKFDDHVLDDRIYIIANYDEADITQEDGEHGHFEFLEYETDCHLYIDNIHVDPVTLFNSMRSIDSSVDEARGYITIKKRGI